MATLTIKDREALGEYVVRAATNEDERKALLADANGKLKEFVVIPAGHKIEVVEQQANVTTMMLPLAADIPSEEEVRTSLRYSEEYQEGSDKFINPEEEPMRALHFLVGDYILKSCR